MSLTDVHLLAKCARFTWNDRVWVVVSDGWRYDHIAARSGQTTQTFGCTDLGAMEIVEAD